MKKRFGQGGRPTKGHGRKTIGPRRSNAAKAAAPSSPSGIREETENARLTRALKEVSEQQTATSLVLRVISSSPGDVEPVFAAMLEDAVEVEPVGEFELKGIRRSLAAYNVVTGHQKI